MRFLFSSAQLPGHLDWGGYLKTAAELRRRGHEVLWATGQAVLPLLDSALVPGHVVEETGWRWPPPAPLPLAPDVEQQDLQRKRMLRSLDQWLDVARVRKATAELAALGRMYRPDLIVSEMFMAAAGIAAEVLDLPFVVVGWPAVQTKVHPEAGFVAEMARERLGRLLAHFRVQGRNWVTGGAPALLSPRLHLTYWSPSWFEGQDLLPQNRHVGGLASPSDPQSSTWMANLPSDRPWVFITLGTTFADDLNFFAAAAQAAASVGGLPILAMGRKLAREQVKRLQPRLPRPAAVVGWADFDSLFPRLAAAIHHGGAGTTHGLVVHGVPQIVVPHAADQARQAAGVQRSGVGLRLAPGQVTPERLEQALTAILPDRGPWRTRALALQAEFAALGGVPRAADLLVLSANGQQV